MAWKTYRVCGEWRDPDAEWGEIEIKARSKEEAFGKACMEERDDGWVFEPEDAEEI